MRCHPRAVTATLGDLMAPHSTPIVNYTRRTVVCEHAVVADRMFPRMRGLLGRNSLPAGEGILLQPAPSIHTAFMRFPIDVIFLDRDLQVVKVVETLGPWRMTSARRAHAALELTAGEAAVRGVEVGDSLGLVAATAGADQTGRNDGADKPVLPIGAVADSIHVLLVGKDRRFRSVTSALLARRGCTVTVGEGLDVAAKSVDVVVIDADSSPMATLRHVADLQTLCPPVGVVVLSDAPSRVVPTGPVLAKWGPFDELYDAIRTGRPDRNWRRAHDRR